MGSWRGYRTDGTAVRKVEHKAGEQFGHLVVVREEIGVRKRKCICWRCVCVCGREVVVSGAKLRCGEVISCGCKNPGHQNGPKSPRWQGGRYISPQGYAYVTAKNHPNANNRGYILEHCLVMSSMLGRPLRGGETVHHKNGIKDDNRPENLELWITSHHYGQRVTDRVSDAIEFLRMYSPQSLSQQD